MAAMAGFFVCQAGVVSAHAYISSLRRDYYCKVQRRRQRGRANESCSQNMSPVSTAVPAKKLDLFRPEIAAALREISYFAAREPAAY